MKKLFLLLALMGIVATGCSKDEVDKGNDNKTEQPNENEGGNEETPVFEIDPEGNYVVESEGGEVLLEVTTNLEYSVYIPKDARSWLFYVETRAVRNETVVLSVGPNSDTELRTATVELRDAEGETLEHFTIVQKPHSIIEDDEPEEDSIFEIDPEGNYVVESEGGEVLLEVTTNLEYSVYIPKDARSWLFYEETRVVRNETVVLSVEPNSDTELRTATVELRDAEGETLEHFTIVQKPHSIIEDDDPEEDPIFESDNEGNYSITAEGGEIVVTVATNIEYSVDIPEEAQSWISLADTRAVHLEKIVFSVAANDTMAERSAVIKLLGADNEVLQDFTITQGAERNITCNSNEIIYTTKYGYAIDLAITDGFGGNYVSHTFKGGYGKIIFDNDVVTIPLNAFRDCNSITNIYLPSCVQEIGKGAFYGCESLASITIPDSLTKIGEWAFAGCALEYVAIDTLSHWCNITFVDDQANPLFYSNDLLVGGEIITTLTVPDDITTINPYAFRGWKNLTNITIHDSVTTIGKYAFSVCKNLSEITIGSGVTTIGDRAFYGCGGVLNINCNIPSVSNYELVPFYNAKLTTVNLGDSVEVVGDYAFRGCDTLTEVNLGNGVQSIGKDAFAYCTGLTSVVIPDSVAQIGDYIFYECSNLSEVVIGSAVTTIGERAFYNCSSLTSLTIPDSVTTIGKYAFAWCDSLTSVTIPDSVTTIGEGAFGYCTGELVVNCNIPSAFYDTDGAFYSSKFTSVTIGDGVTTIGDYAFYNCNSLTSVTIPDSVTSIGNYAFRGCNSLTSITIPDSVTTIGNYAFSGCSSLTSVTIPDRVTEIGSSAFEGCSSLTSVTIPDRVTTIGAWAFYYCDSLTSVSIGDSVTTIGDWAFYHCSSLTSVTIPDSVTTIGGYAFRDCSSLTSVTIPDSVITIRGGAFYQCSSLTSITIPDSVTTIGYEAFYDCTSLTSVYCKAVTPPAGGSDMFYNNASGRKIYVPMESVEVYKSAKYWSDYADYIEGYNF